MGSYWNSKWKTLEVELAQADWKTFRTDSRVMQHLENPTTGRVLAVAPKCLEDFGVPIELMRDSLVGAPRGVVNFAGVPVTRASVEHARMAWAVRAAVDRWDLRILPARRIVEIGGGFGGLAWALCRALRVEKYTFIDHPAVLRIQEKFVDGLHEELGVESTWPVDDFRFVRCDEYEETDWPDKVDIVLNTRSMMEMDQAEVNRYFGWIASVLSPGGIFYSLNRLEKVTRMDDWPWGLFDVVERRRWPEYLDRGPMDEIVARLRP